MKVSFMKVLKFFTFTLIIAMIVSIATTPDALAAKKKKKLTDEEVTQITDTLTSLTKKVYAAGLFSPEDNEQLIDVKLKLDEVLESNTSNKDFPQLYYRAGIVYKIREYREEAIECFQTILDIFPDSPYALKATGELKKMGVKIISPDSQESEVER